MRLTVASLLLALSAVSASAATVTFDLPGDTAPSRETVSYACGERKIVATYINAGDNALALVDLGDRTVVMVSVLSGSGARYAGQQFVWWTKGDDASLYDLTRGEDSDPVVACHKAA